MVVFDINILANITLMGKIPKKSRCVCETQQYAPGGNKVQKDIFTFKVKVKVTRSLTLVSFKSVSLVEYACQI